jgi:hypothetical protein
MVVQVRAHGAVTTRDAVAAVDIDSAGPIIDIVQYELADVSRVDEATGDRLVDLEVDLARPLDDGDEPQFDRVDQLDLFEPGVYPVTIQIRRDQRVIARHTTFIEVLDDTEFGRSPLRFALVANVPDPGPTPTERDLDDAREQIERIVDLANSTSAPVTAAIPPTVIAALEGVDADLIDRLRAALVDTDGLITQPDFALDPSSAAAAGLDEELAHRFVEGEALLTSTFPTVPVSRSAWPVTGVISPGGAGAVRDLGVPMLIVTDERYLTYEGNIGGFVDTTLLSNAALDDGSQIRMAIADPVGSWLDPDVDTSFSAVERAVRIMATANALRHELSPDLRTMILTSPGLRTPDAATTAAMEHFVNEHPKNTFDSIQRVPNSTNALFIDQEPHVVGLPDQIPLSLESRVREADAMRLQIADVATMLPDDDDRPPQWDDELQLAMSTGLSLAEAETVFADVESGIDDLRTSVGEPETFPITIGSREADIPVRIANDSSTPLEVVIRLTGEKLSVPGGDQSTVLDPNGVTETAVPVIARSNGVFPVTIEVVTPAGNPLGEPVEFTARVNNLTGLGRVVTVGAALVLISWWFSYYRRKRRNRVDLAAGRHPSNPRPEPPTLDEVVHATEPSNRAAATTRLRPDLTADDEQRDDRHARSDDEGVSSPHGATNRTSE